MFQTELLCSPRKRGQKPGNLVPLGWAWPWGKGRGGEGAEVFTCELGRGGRGQGDRRLKSHQTAGKARGVRGVDLANETRVRKVWKWKWPFVSMLITPCFQHSTPGIPSGFSPNSAPGAGCRPRRGLGSAGAALESAEQGLGKVLGAAEKPTLFSLANKKYPPLHPSPQCSGRGGGGFAQSLGTAERGGGTRSKVDDKGSTGIRGEQLGFPERGAAAQAGRAGRIAPGAPEQPAGLARARPPRRAPARGAALRASRPGPAAPLLAQRGRVRGPALQETLDSGLVPLCPFRSAH